MGFHSPPSATGKPNPLSFLRVLRENLYLDLALKKVTWIETPSCHNVSCHPALPHHQRATVFAWSKDGKDRRNETIPLEVSLGLNHFFLRKECMTHDHSTARENLHSIMTKISSDPSFPAQKLSTAHNEQLRKPHRYWILQDPTDPPVLGPDHWTSGGHRWTVGPWCS